MGCDCYIYRGLQEVDLPKTYLKIYVKMCCIANCDA